APVAERQPKDLGWLNRRPDRLAVPTNGRRIGPVAIAFAVRIHTNPGVEPVKQRDLFCAIPFVLLTSLPIRTTDRNNFQSATRRDGEIEGVIGYRDAEPGERGNHRRVDR